MKYGKSLFKGINCFLLIFLISLSVFSQGQLLCDEGFEDSTPDGTFQTSGCWKEFNAGGGAGAFFAHVPRCPSGRWHEGMAKYLQTNLPASMAWLSLVW